MVQKIDWIEFLVVAVALFFATALCLFHISDEGYLGLKSYQWDMIWAVSENGLTLWMSIIIVMLSGGIIKNVFKYIFIPYFILKMYYHIRCYSNVHMLKDRWEDIWSVACVLLLVVGMSCCLLLIRRRTNHVAKIS